MAAGRVLVLLEDGAETELAARLLGTRGWSAEAATSPDQLVGGLGAGSVAVVVGHPLASGTTSSVLASVRAQPAPAGAVPAVVIGEHIPTLERMRAYDAGADALVETPFHIDDLSGLLDDLVARPPAERARNRSKAMDTERKALAEERRSR